MADVEKSLPNEAKPLSEEEKEVQEEIEVVEPGEKEVSEDGTELQKTKTDR